ncbi:hypothetical protein D3C76_1302450 [compost metagenome]
MTSLLSPEEHYKRDLKIHSVVSEQERDRLYVIAHSAKRLVQTSPPYPSAVEALEACHANQQDDFCDYAYVTQDNRVVGIYDYYDVTPDKPVKPGQRRVTIPVNF